MLILIIAGLAVAGCDLTAEHIVQEFDHSTTYVAVDGNDSRSCYSEFTACKSISAALAQLEFTGEIDRRYYPNTEFGTIYVAAGVYDATGEGHPEVLTIENNIRIIGAGPSETIIEFTREAQTYEFLPREEEDDRHAILSNLQFQDNRPPVSGLNPLVSSNYPRISWENCIFKGNGNGDGVRIQVDVGTINNCEFFNFVTAFTVSVSHTDFRIYDSVFRDNQIGVHVTSWVYDICRGPTYMQRVEIKNNSKGGLIEQCSTFIMIVDSEFSGNVGLTGSAILSESSNMQISNSTFRNNHTTGWGGSTLQLEIESQIYNSTISENTSDNEGVAVIFLEGGFIANSTISHNEGNGVWVRGSSRVDITSSIIANNTGSQCQGASAEDIFFSRPNLVSDETCGPDPYMIVQPFAPFSALQDYGGPTLPSGHAPFTIALEPGNPAIDAWDCISEGRSHSAWWIHDQRGIYRPQGSKCDLGAFEVGFIFDLESIPTPPPPEPVPLSPDPFATEPISLSKPTTNQTAPCFRGPGYPYEVVSSVQEGTEVYLLGIGEFPSWLIIDNPIYTGVHCWIDADALDIDPNFNLNDLQVYKAPILPTSTFTPVPKVVTPPNSPSGLVPTEISCNTTDGYVVMLSWKDNANNETGYRVYRNDNLIATLGSNVTEYTDHPPGSGPYSYQVEAFNSAGSNESNLAQEDGCIY